MRTTTTIHPAKLLQGKHPKGISLQYYFTTASSRR